MTPGELVIPPPTPKMGDYPVLFTIGGAVIFTMVAVFFATRFDPTLGVLTISLLVVVAFLGVAVFCLFFTVPNDEITSGVLGGLIASFGAVIAHWLGRTKEGPK
jgi:uncharacterized BrkB/YihY/UPF0761 family membrane protein